MKKGINKLLEENIQKILSTYNLTTNENLLEIINSTLTKQENNIRFICKSKNTTRYVFKYSIAGLTSKTKQTGIRAKLNLTNEVLFYQKTDVIDKQNIIIPKLLGSSLKHNNSWLIIQFLENAEIFKPDISFKKYSYPNFFTQTFIKGIEEFQEFKINKTLFHRTTFEDSKKWRDSFTSIYTGKLNKKKEVIDKLFLSFKNIWNKNIKFISHMDILPDTIGYDRTSHKLVLLDFEKVQISHIANDFASIAINPLTIEWNKDYEKQLFEKFPNMEFKILYQLSKLLRLLSKLNNYKTGRLDHIFKEIIEEKVLIAVKKQSIPLLEKEILKIIEEVTSHTK